MGVVIFREAIFPQTYKDLATRLSKEVGWPVMYRESLDLDWLRRKVKTAISGILDHRDEVMSFQEKILDLEFRVGKLKSALDSGRF